MLVLDGLCLIAPTQPDAGYPSDDPKNIGEKQ
jgi:hypothetical protein